MKKIFKFLNFLAWITLFYSFSFAKTLDDILTSGTSKDSGGHRPSNLVETPGGPGTSEDVVLYFIARAVDIILYFAWVIAMIMIIYWWFRYITYFWSEESEEEAKKTIIHGLLWLAVVIVSVLILDNAKDFIYFLFWQRSNLDL